MNLALPSAPPELTDQLDDSETLRWWGRPRPAHYVAGGAMLTVPLGLFALGSAYTWIGGLDPSALPAWAIGMLVVLLLFAAHMILARPLLSYRQAQQTFYGVTDRRSLAICTSGKGRVFEVPHHQGDLLMVKGLHGAWKVQFGRTASSSVDVLLMGRAAVPGFYGLESVEEVRRVLEEVRKG